MTANSRGTRNGGLLSSALSSLWTEETGSYDC